MMEKNAAKQETILVPRRCAFSSMALWGRLQEAEHSNHVTICHVVLLN